MTSTTTTTATVTFEIFSLTTGHSFGVWEGRDEADVFAQLADQSGSELDLSDLEAVEIC